MIELGLGWRFAVASGRARPALIITANALGTSLLLLAVGIPGALPRAADAQDHRFGTVVGTFLALPVLCLLASATRLSAAARDRRLAALRLLGMSATRTRRVAAWEAGALAAVGAALGSVGFGVGLAPAVSAIDDRWENWFVDGGLPPGALGWILTVAAVLAVSTLISVIPVSRTADAALSVRRQGRARRPSAWRLLPLVAGTALLARSAFGGEAQDANAGSAGARLFFVGSGLAALSLPLVVPFSVRFVGDLLTWWRPSVPVLIAGRRLQQEPASTSRLVAGLLLALFVLSAGRCVLVEAQNSPQHLRASLAEGSGPQLVQITSAAGPLDVPALRALPGVAAAVPAQAVHVLCPGATGHAAMPCADAFIGTCADLQVFSSGISGCEDDTAAWLVRAGERSAQPGAVVLARVAASHAGAGSARVTLEGVRRVLLTEADRDPNWAPPARLFVPAGLAGSQSLASAPSSAFVVLAGGEAAVARMQRMLPSGTSVMREDLSPLRTVRGYEAIFLAVSSLVLTLSLAALLITGVDHAAARRRHVASLAILGVPRRVVRRSQFLQTLAPLVLGLPLATSTGLLAGFAYLKLTGHSLFVPWLSVTALLGSALGASLLIALATVLGLGGRVRADDIRRE